MASNLGLRSDQHVQTAPRRWGPGSCEYFFPCSLVVGVTLVWGHVLQLFAVALVSGR